MMRSVGRRCGALPREHFAAQSAHLRKGEAMTWIRTAILFLACGMPLLACTMLQSANAAPRPFTIAEEAIIERNEALRAVYETDPALVRRVLNALKSRGQSKDKQRDVFGPRVPGGQHSGPSAPSDPGADIDPATNPDLAILQRGSPEAAHDLFQLLKKASGRK